MAMGRQITTHLVILLLHVSLSVSEIHRAKITPLKAGRTREQPNSYVAAEAQIGPKPDMPENATNLTAGEMTGFKYEVWAYSLLGSVLVGLSGILPLLIIPMEAGPALKHGAAASRLKLLLSFAVGGLLGDVFLHLLPEAWAHLDIHDHAGHSRLGLWTIGGMLSFLIIEKMFAKEGEFEHLADECEVDTPPLAKLQNGTTKVLQNGKVVQNGNSTMAKHRSSTSKHKHHKQNHQKSKDTKQKSIPVPQRQKSEEIKVSGYLNLAANVIDNFTHGLAVAAGFLVSIKVGFITTAAILLHEIPHEVGDFAILLRSGFDRWKAAKAQLLTATGGIVGALTALTADSAQAAGDSTAWILPFTSGGFIYIAMVTVVPDLLEEIHPKESAKQVLCLVCGVAAMYVVSLVH